MKLEPLIEGVSHGSNEKLDEILIIDLHGVAGRACGCDSVLTRETG
jgi:hypothetical protein